MSENNSLEKRLIDGYPDYAATPLGIWSYKRSKLLSPGINSRGYPTVGLYRSGKKRRTQSVHRLIALAFIPNPLNLPDVDHIDRDKSNFSIDNLRWTTKSENRLNISEESRENISKAAKDKSHKRR